MDDRYPASDLDRAASRNEAELAQPAGDVGLQLLVSTSDHLDQVAATDDPDNAASLTMSTRLTFASSIIRAAWDTWLSAETTSTWRVMTSRRYEEGCRRLAAAASPGYADLDESGEA